MMMMGFGGESTFGKEFDSCFSFLQVVYSKTARKPNIDWDITEDAGKTDQYLLGTARIC